MYSLHGPFFRGVAVGHFWVVAFVSTWILGILLSH